MTTEIIPYEHRYHGGVAELFTRLWTKDIDINQRYLEWRYLQDPLIRAPLLYLAVEDGTVVGVRGARGVAWDIGRADDVKRYVVPCVGDTVIADSHAGRGILNQLTQKLLDDMNARGFTYTFNLSPGKVTLLSSLTSGWRSIGRWPTVLRKEQRQGDGKNMSGFDELDHHLAGRDPNNEAIRICDRPLPEAMARIAADAAVGTASIRPVVDADYLMWRFQNPINQYRFIYHESTDIDGYLVLKIARRNPRVVLVLDLQANHPDTLTSLIRSAVDLGGFPDLRLWWLRLPAQTMRTLKELGFASPIVNDGIGRFLPTFLVRPTAPDVSRSSWSINDVPLLDLVNWEIKMLVSDGS